MWLERPAPCFEMQLIKKHLYRWLIRRTFAEKGPAFEVRLEVTCRPDAGSLPRG